MNVVIFLFIYSVMFNLFFLVYLFIISLLVSFSHQLWLGIFHWSLRDKKSFQVSTGLLGFPELFSVFQLI